MFSQPLTFEPLYQPRVWGGRRLEHRLGRVLPPKHLIGEAWDLVDRPEAQSVVNAGPHAGKTLHELWTRHRPAVFGREAPDTPRFPLLAKLLDARETLSVQVHPPASIAAFLQAEPKTEMWYVLEADPGAAIFAGFKKGVTRTAFEKALRDHAVAELLHRISVRAGDAITIPSGRCHAIGAGCLIAEIQQNSDSTYRVFDWNRLGLDGKPRDLHIAESLQSIQFDDHEPSLEPPEASPLAHTDWFRVQVLHVPAGEPVLRMEHGFFWVLNGLIRCGERVFEKGSSFWLPAEYAGEMLSSEGGRLLWAGFGGARST